MILAYPPAARSDQVDTYNGTKVADPCRWLEDIDSADTWAWVEAEAKLSKQHAAPKGKPILIRIEIRAGYGQALRPPSRSTKRRTSTRILSAFGMTP